jgi:type IV pilus assembly protein PilY1
MRSSSFPRNARSVLALTLGVAALTAAGGASADLAQQPLTLAGVAKPNVIVVIDDSGSMDWEVLFPTESGQLHWNFDSDLPVDDTGAYYTTTQGRAYSYLFPNGTGSGNKSYPITSSNGHPLAPRPEYAFARSSAFNAQFYDPSVTYKPWPDQGGYTFADADPKAALSDPTVAGSHAMDLTAEQYVTGDDEFGFTTSGGSRGPDADGRASDTIFPGRTTHAYRYFPATYYVPIKDSVALPAWLDGNCDSPDPLDYRTFVLSWSVVNQAALEGVKVDAIGPGGICLRKVEIRSGGTFPGGRSYDDELQNFANWYSYHRKRHLALRAGLGGAFVSKSGVRVGSFTINNRNAVTMWDFDTAASKSDFFKFMYEVRGTQGGTPNRQALNYAGGQFNRSTSPVITAACQKNFALHFTDGYANSYTDGDGNLLDFNAGNADGDNGSPFQDSYSNTIADIAQRWYETRLMTTLPAGKVPVPAACSFANAPKYLDCQKNLHMNTYGVTLGARGTIFGATHLQVRDAHITAPTWVSPNAANLESRPVQVDDLYHAAVNGRGELLNARSTAELSAKLGTALQSILESVTGSASAVSSNSTRLDADTLIYQARFDSRNWGGELIAFDLEADGDIGVAAWDAADLVPAPDLRRIFTRNSAGTGIKFQWGTNADQLDATQRAAFEPGADGLGESRVNYLRGDRTLEAPAGAFRQRDSRLGDIVNSSPWFVGGQNFGYDQLPDGAEGKTTYAAFREANLLTRAKTIYVGSNDGMLHGFDAATGAERFAFVPSQFTLGSPAPLVRLTDPAYVHRYFVDGTPVAGDVHYDSAWHTVLVGTLGAGGEGVYALDVTDPTNFGAAQVLWELDDAGLGNVIGRASIARMANGSSAAIFGNGYGSGQGAKLYIRNIKTGAEIRTLSTSTDNTPSDNGLSSPIPIDTNGDRVIDLVYAGDLHGNLWKFDVSSSDPANWKVAFDTGSGPVPRPPRPLFRACATGDATDPFLASGAGCAVTNRQPITMRPEVGRGPTAGSLMIYFGTGKFYEVGDNVVTAATPKQTFYAIRDDNGTVSGGADVDRVAGRSELVQQTITQELAFDSNDFVRVTSKNAVPNTRFGWYMDLLTPNPPGAPINNGERAIAQPILREGRIIFTTLIPSGDACDPGGESWLMEVDALSGGRLDNPVFDLNDDMAFTDGDNVDHDGNVNTPRLPPSGRRSEVGIIQTPAIISAGGVEYKVTGGSSGGIESITERGNLSKGRNSWRQLWPGE